MSEQPGPEAPIDWYASPGASSIERQQAQPVETGEAEPVYFPISVTKLAVLCVCTLGLYQLYWCFKSWQYEATQEGRGRYIGPAFRAAFGVLFCYPLFVRIRRTTRRLGSPPLRAGWLAVAWIALTLSYKLPDPYWLINSASFVPVLFVQRVVNELNAEESPSAPKNAEFSAGELVLCAVGACLLAFTLIATFNPDFLPA